MLRRAWSSSSTVRVKKIGRLDRPSVAQSAFSDRALPIDPNITTLLRNTELSPEDARNELRWIEQEARESVQKQAAVLFGVAMPKKEDVEAMKGLEKGVIMGLVERRAQGEPLQYILGNVDFGPLTLICRPPTLIPRPETADIFTRLADYLTASFTPDSKPLQILDLCSGSGCIPLLLSHQLRDRLDNAIGIDIGPKALALARENAKALDINNVSFAEMDLFSPIFVADYLRKSGGEKASIVTANPPYISQAEWEALPASVKRYEDPRALLGDQDGKGDGKGLAFYRRLAELLPDLLRSEEDMGGAGWGKAPRVVLEIGEAQGRDVQEIIRESGDGHLIVRTEIWQDQYGKDRAVVGWTG